MRGKCNVRKIGKEADTHQINQKIYYFYLIITGVSTFITWVLNSRDEDTFNTSKTSVKCKAVHIDCGDTVWDIAREYKSSNTDMREAVYAILNVNDIEASDLAPGMTLNIPTSI